MRSLRGFSVLLVAAGVLLAACSDNPGLGTAAAANAVDTVSLYALSGTSITLPSGFWIRLGVPVRTDQSTFDFAFDITPGGQAELLPTAALGLPAATGASGILVQNSAFDAITLAPTSAYEQKAAVPVDSGTVAVVHSAEFCGIAFYYGKLQVLAIDTVARRIDLQVLVDKNCGFRGLEPGLPKQ